MVDPNAKTVATVLITTKDRKEDLARAIRSVIAQTANVELLIVDDGSTDGTSDLAVEICPGARVVRNPKSLGIIEARNRAARLASCPILFTLDDDAEYSDPETIEQALQLFEHPRVGAIAIPLINIIGDQRTELDRVPNASESDFFCLASYRGGANAKRVDIFLELGAYGGVGRQGEDSSYCIRMLDAGYCVRATSLPPVLHYPSPVRCDRGQILGYAAQNTLLFGWEFAPLTRLPIHLAGVLRNQSLIAWKERRIGAVALGIVAGCVAMVRTPRRPVAPQSYRLYRSLVSRGPIRQSEIGHALPNLGNPFSAIQVLGLSPSDEKD